MDFESDRCQRKSFYPMPMPIRTGLNTNRAGIKNQAEDALSGLRTTEMNRTSSEDGFSEIMISTMALPNVHISPTPSHANSNTDGKLRNRNRLFCICHRYQKCAPGKNEKLPEIVALTTAPKHTSQSKCISAISSFFTGNLSPGNGVQQTYRLVSPSKLYCNKDAVLPL